MELESKENHQESLSENCSDMGDHRADTSHLMGVQDMKCQAVEPKNTVEEISIESLVKDVGEDMRATCMQWIQPMAENEKFEKLSPSQVDDLLEAARSLEAHLQQEKQKLLTRLQVLSRTLQLAS